jgi:hypothetical protein
MREPRATPPSSARHPGAALELLAQRSRETSTCKEGVARLALAALLGPVLSETQSDLFMLMLHAAPPPLPPSSARHPGGALELLDQSTEKRGQASPTLRFLSCLANCTGIVLDSAAMIQLVQRSTYSSARAKLSKEKGYTMIKTGQRNLRKNKNRNENPEGDETSTC